MKTITVKETVNTGNYENFVIEISIDRPPAMSLESFLIMVKHQLAQAKEALLK